MDYFLLGNVVLTLKKLGIDDFSADDVITVAAKRHGFDDGDTVLEDVEEAAAGDGKVEQGDKDHFPRLHDEDDLGALLKHFRAVNDFPGRHPRRRRW